MQGAASWTTLTNCVRDKGNVESTLSESCIWEKRIILDQWWHKKKPYIGEEQLHLWEKYTQLYEKEYNNNQLNQVQEKQEETL